jgi:hypothetical protein
MRNVADKFVEDIKNIFCVQKYFAENLTFYEIMRKILLEPERPEMTVKHGVCAFHAG